MITKLAMAFAALSLVSTNPAQACMRSYSESKVIDLMASNAEAIRLQTGDLVRFEYTYPLTPNAMIESVKVKTDKDLLPMTVKNPITAEYPNRRYIVGVGGEALYFRALGDGKVTLRIRLVNKAGTVVRDVEQDFDIVTPLHAETRCL